MKWRNTRSCLSCYESGFNLIESFRKGLSVLSVDSRRRFCLDDSARL